MTASSATSDVPPRWARVYVISFLSFMIFCAAFSVEAWPFSGFRLFSSIRTSTSRSFHLVVTDREGQVSGFPSNELPRSERNQRWIIEQFPSLTKTQQRKACNTWLATAKRNNKEIQRVSLVIRRFRNYFDGSAKLISSKLVGECL